MFRRLQCWWYGHSPADPFYSVWWADHYCTRCGKLLYQGQSFDDWGV